MSVPIPLLLIWGIIKMILPIVLFCAALVAKDKIKDAIANKKYERKHKAEGFKILQDATMKKAIVEAESRCPVCGGIGGQFHDMVPRYGQHQFFYQCKDCHSTWQGNLYDENFNKIA